MADQSKSDSPKTMNLTHTQDTFKIAQISDLHLSNPKSFDDFLQVLDLALSHSPNLLILTGDLVNDGKKHGYDWLFDTLDKTRIPYLCMAGNHDVTHEIGHHLPFHERTFLPIDPDLRLPNHQRLIIQMPSTTWQILTLNSAISGQIHGKISADSLQFLRHHLSNDLLKNLPTIIALHHHPCSVGSAWIDEHMLINYNEFWQTLAGFDNIKAILCGHVHQAHTIHFQGKTLLTCPATSRQFAPHQDDFAIDHVSSGFRLIQICNKKTLATWVKRTQN